MESTSLQHEKNRLFSLGIDLNSYKEQFLEKSFESKENKEEFFLNETTSFFRDKEVFSTLEEILKEKNPQGKFRVYNPACSTGEESYSLGITLSKLNIDFKIFATDMSLDLLGKAQRGFYSGFDLQNLDEDLINSYFNKLADLYEIKKKVKERLFFQQENILKMKKYKEIDLIVCRNLFIYLEDEVQETLIKNFAEILKENAILVLGKSESPSNINEYFTPLNYSEKIFQKI